MKKPIQLTLLLTLLLMFATGMQAQESTASFEFDMRLDGNMLELKCHNGCVWKELSASNKKIFLNQNGMNDGSDATTDKSDYLIYIERKGDKITLTGKKGTAWESLEVTIPRNGKATVNQNGTRSTK